MTRHHMVPLTMLPLGAVGNVAEIRAGQSLTHRLSELGLTPGTEIRVIQDAGGPLLIAVGDSRLALGRGMAHKLLISLATSSEVK